MGRVCGGVADRCDACNAWCCNPVAAWRGHCAASPCGANRIQEMSALSYPHKCKFVLVLALCRSLALRRSFTSTLHCSRARTLAPSRSLALLVVLLCPCLVEQLEHTPPSVTVASRCHTRPTHGRTRWCGHAHASCCVVSDRDIFDALFHGDRTHVEFM